MELKKFNQFISEEKGYIHGDRLVTKMRHHIGKNVNVTGGMGEVCKLLSIDVFDVGGILRYYGTIERIRGKKSFKSRRMLTHIQPV